MTVTTRAPAADRPTAPAASPVPPGTTPASFTDRLMHVLVSADDLSDGSDELELACTSWHDRYHLSSARANVLRTLHLPADASVLEIGARAGAVTRHLGETYATVDALEPDAAMAAVASRRCHDLPSVSVRAGWIDDLDPSARFDLVVAIDVIDEVDRRGGDLDAFLLQCRSLLTDRGVLVVGADNTDGVRFRAGDATPRLRPDVADRPRRVRRDDLAAGLRATGLEATVLSAFPDHRAARTVFDHDPLATAAPVLLTALPDFPSPPHDGPRAALFPEARWWSDALADGTARDAANGLVAIATAGPPVTDDVATYWSMGRRAALSATNAVVVDDGAVTVRRSRTFPSAGPVDGPLSVRPHVEPFHRGAGLTELVATAPDLEGAAAFLRDWSALVDRRVTIGEPLPWDLIPRNVLQLDDGDLAAFDQEWELEASPRGAQIVRSRGAFWLAYDLCFRGHRPDWLPGRTIGETADVLLRLADPAAPSDWHRTFVDDESTHMSHIWPTDRRHTRPALARRERINVSSLSNTQPPGGPGHEPGDDTSPSLLDLVESLTAENADLRAENEELRREQRHLALVHRDHVVGLVAESETVREALARKQRESRRHKERVARLQKQVKDLQASRTWRVGQLVLRPFGVLRRLGRR